MENNEGYFMFSSGGYCHCFIGRCVVVNYERFVGINGWAPIIYPPMGRMLSRIQITLYELVDKMPQAKKLRDKDFRQWKYQRLMKQLHNWNPGKFHKGKDNV